MRKRLLILDGVMLVAVLGATALFWPDRFGPASYTRIELGMTEEEVERIIGLPPGDYYTGYRGIGGVTSRGPWGFKNQSKGLTIDESTSAAARSGGVARKTWWGNTYALDVAFDREGRVVGCYLWDVVGATDRRSLYERLRNKLPW